MSRNPEDIEIITIPDCLVLCASYVGAGSKLPALWRDLMFRAAKAGYLRPWPAMLGLVYDDLSLQKVQECLRYDACIVLPEGEDENSGARGLKKIEGGTFVSARHTGSNEDRGLLYDYLLSTWLPEHGVRHRAGPNHEYYESSLLELMRGRFRTRICIPVDQ